MMLNNFLYVGTSIEIETVTNATGYLRKYVDGDTG